MPVAEGCEQAAIAAAVDAIGRQHITAEDVRDIGIELELLAPAEPIGTAGDLTDQLVSRFEPCIHGVALRYDNKEARIRPSEIITMATKLMNQEMAGPAGTYRMAITKLIEKLVSQQEANEQKLNSVIVFRFRSTHLYEPKSGASPVELIAGLRWISPEEVTHESLLAAVDKAAAFLQYRQNRDGSFAYEYLPDQAFYEAEGQSWVRQAATTWSLALHARRRQNEGSASGLDRSFAIFRPMLMPLPNHRDTLFVATPDGKNPLGAAALLALAFMDAPDHERYTDLYVPLLNGIAAMQSNDGSFLTAFPPASPSSNLDYFPGEALLALAKQYVLTNNPKWREICDKAFPYYRTYYRKLRPPAFIPWHVQAWGHLARATHKQEYADFVYEMSDDLAKTQLLTPNSQVPIYRGGFDVYQSGRTGIASAVYLEGFNDALRTAEALGDKRRTERYRRIVTEAVRFVMQLQFREEECYYVLAPREVIGALRNTPFDPSLRIDHAQHALAAMLGASDYFSPSNLPIEKRSNQTGKD